MAYGNNKCNIILLAVMLAFSGCRDSKTVTVIPTEKFALYTSKDTFSIDENLWRLIPQIDRIIEIDSAKTTLEKIRTIADSLSVFYFNGLKIDVRYLTENQTEETIVGINLIESEKFTGPGSLPSYHSWYDYFQGSAGGANTAIILQESFLQRDFEGKWIDGIQFFYNGDTFNEWDHIDLQGLKKR